MAFDRVWHKGLLFKLAAIGCSKSLLRSFTSYMYLSGHRQRVVINGVISDWASIFAGVPQGSILGPLLFLIFINDIVNNIQSNIRLFADDTSLYIIVENPNTASLTLNSDLGTWSDHVKNIVEKAWPRLNLLRGLKFILRRYALERMYISFIRPLIEYSDAVWDNCSTE